MRVTAIDAIAMMADPVHPILFTKSGDVEVVKAKMLLSLKHAEAEDANEQVLKARAVAQGNVIFNKRMQVI